MVSYREKLGWLSWGEQASKLRMVRILWTGTGLDKISSWSELRINVSVRRPLRWIGSTVHWVQEVKVHDMNGNGSYILVKWSTTHTRNKRRSEMTQFGELTFGEMPFGEMTFGEVLGNPTNNSSRTHNDRPILISLCFTDSTTILPHGLSIFNTLLLISDNADRS